MTKSDSADHGRRQAGQHRRAAERVQGLAQGVHQAAPSSAESNTIRPWSSSMTRSPGAAHQLQVVRREQDGRARGVDGAEQLEDAVRGALVEVARRLVRQHDQRIVHERPRDRHALLLAAGQLAGSFSDFAARPTCASRRRPSSGSRSGARRSPPARTHVLRGRPVLQQPEILEHVADLAAQHGDLALPMLVDE
jgi:hypothetical protein